MSAAGPRVRRVRRPADPPTTAECTCQPRPLTVATFRNEHLVNVIRHHLMARGCRHPDEVLNNADWGWP